MTTITTINGSDTITSSRTVINDNLSNLNTDKIETSVLDTDTSLAANSDSKIATQKAVKAYVDAGGNVNASDTNKGIVELATQAEYSAKTATGPTGAALVVPNSIGPVIETTAGATHSLTTVAGQRVIVWAKASFTGTSAEQTVDLKYNAVSKDTIKVQLATSTDTMGCALMYTETPGAGTHDITLTVGTGTLSEVVIIVLKF